MTEKKIYGNRLHRLKDLPYGKDELKLSQEFHKMLFSEWNAICFKCVDGLYPESELNEREKNIVASVIQWLGTPIGKNFLEGSGFLHRESITRLIRCQERVTKKMSIWQFMKWRKTND